MGKFVDGAACEIQATLDGMEEAYADRDLDPFVGYFTDDIVAMPSGMAPIVGADAWRELLTGFFAGPALSNRVNKSEDITVVGDWAIEWHTEAATYTSKESGDSNRVYNKACSCSTKAPPWRQRTDHTQASATSRQAQASRPLFIAVI